MEQQILRCSVLFDVILKAGKQAGFILRRVIVDLFHIGGIALEDTEASIKVLRCQRTVFFDFSTCTADALLADFTDVLVSCFIGFTLFIGHFGKLNHNELAVPAIFCVKLHNGMGSCSRTGEEVENKIILFC